MTFGFDECPPYLHSYVSCARWNLAPNKGVFLVDQYSIGKKMTSWAKTRFPPNYRKLAKAAFKQALENKFGSHGAASAVRRIDPKTGKVLEEIRSADDIRRSLGPELAARL